MARNLPDFQQKLKDLCKQHDVFIKGIKVKKERPTGPNFYHFELSAKDDEQEGLQELTEISKSLS